MPIALITGSSGHVGSNLIRELSKQDYKIRCIDFDGDHRAYEGFDVELIKGDITNKESLHPIFKNVDIVFHTAALINLDRRYEKQIRQVEGTGPLKATDNKHFKIAVKNPHQTLFYRQPINPSLDGNTVELSVEQLEFSENSVRYQTSLEFLNKRIAGLMSAIKGE